MQLLKQSSLLAVHGAGFSGCLSAMTFAIAGMSIGATVGSQYAEPMLPYIVTSNPTYFGTFKNTVADFYISTKYGHLGVDSKADVIGAFGGAFVGSIIGAGIYGALN